jgi:hypothetical protein
MLCTPSQAPDVSTRDQSKFELAGSANLSSFSNFYCNAENPIDSPSQDGPPLSTFVDR